MKLKEFLGENVRIGGDIESDANDYYTKVGQYLIKELNIPTDVTVVVHVASTHGLDKTQNGSTLPDLQGRNAIHVYLLPGLDRATLLRAMCHEFVHVQQIATKRLVLDIQNGRLLKMEWEGKKVPPNYNRNSEWELEAHIKEKELLHKVIGAVGNLM